MINEHKIVIKNANGSSIGELQNFKKLTYSKILNDYGVCKFSISVTDTNLSDFVGLRRFETQIYREGTLVWAGEQALLSGPIEPGGENLVEIVSFGYFEQLYGRLTSEIYDGVDAGSIAWGMINTSQNETDGDFGITQGTIENTQNRDRNYSDDVIATEIKRLTAVINGFDFELTDDKVFNVYEHKGIDRSNQIVFELGTNIERIPQLIQDFSIIANQTVVRGEGAGTEQARVVRTDTTSRGIYGLRQRVLSETSTSETTTLNEKGDANNALRKQPIQQLRMIQAANTQPSFGSIFLGDQVRLRVVFGIHNINNIYRVVGWEVTVDEKGAESVEYYISI